MEVDLGQSIDATGKKKRVKKYKTITTNEKREAEKHVAKFVPEVTSNDYFEPEKMELTDFVTNIWLPKHAEKPFSHTTLSTHKRYLELRIIPAFQELRLDQVKPLHIIDFINNLSENRMRKDKKDGTLSSAVFFTTIEF